MIKLILIVLAALLSGCASIVSTVSEGHPNRNTIAVPPGSTTILLDGSTIVDSDKDGWIVIPRGAGAFRSNVGRVENDQKEILGVVKRGITPWVLGNFLPYNGVVIGFIVDFAGGGAYNPKFVPVKSDREVLIEIETSTKTQQ